MFKLLMKINSFRVLIFFCLTLSFAACATTSVHYSKKNGTYRVYGHVEGKMNSGYYNYDNRLYLIIPGRQSLEVYVGRVYCKTEEDAFKKVNELLSGQGSIAYPGAIEATFSFYCQKEQCSSAMWYFLKNFPQEPPTPYVSCNIDIPGAVDFGEVSMGGGAILRTLKGSATCDAKTSVALSLSGKNIINQQIKIGDAVVEYAFDNGKATATVSAEKAVTSSFDLNFILKNTGKAAGNKQASVVLNTEWY
ncbi:hypothetical protein [Erwinia aphidicola]|uniref:hypothetical protein n=2 Tax=Erwinia aphidicola TaxID=68334 RepID=UPI0030D2ED2A